MPSKNSLKIYVENGIYHVYNRGVEKRIIFQDEQDYKVFLSYLKQYLSPESSLQGQSLQTRRPKNHSSKIKLLVFCLMPNHFHMMIEQTDKNAISSFMKSLLTRYSMYFNRKYKRVGSLFQSRYKAILIKEEPYLLHLSRYIHLNPVGITEHIVDSYSSYSRYLGSTNTPWIHPELILSFFAKNEPTLLTPKHNTYKDFVEDYIIDSTTYLGNLTLESDDDT